jgi:putative peptidoglycan lipid II flippase
MVSNMILNLILVWFLAHAGLALATSISAFINASLLYVGLRRSGVYSRSSGWWWFLFRVIFASAVMIGLVAWLNPAMSTWYDWGFWYRMMILLLLCSAGVVSYGLALLVTGFRLKQLQH